MDVTENLSNPYMEPILNWDIVYTSFFVDNLYQNVMDIYPCSLNTLSLFSHLNIFYEIFLEPVL